jgi:hypothetical protein
MQAILNFFRLFRKSPTGSVATPDHAEQPQSKSVQQSMTEALDKLRTKEKASQ